MSDWIAQHFLHPSYLLPWGVALAAGAGDRASHQPAALTGACGSRDGVLAEESTAQQTAAHDRAALVASAADRDRRRLLVLVSRLVLDPSALWAFRGEKSHHVVLLDDSGSMRDRWGETSAFREGLAIVRRLVAEGARRPGTQQCTLLLLSQPDHPMFQKRDVNNAFPS